MSRVSFIIRAQNRLEYTSLVIREIDLKAGYDNYNMIVVDQASSDGTTQWLKSLEIEKYYKLKVQYNTINSGDAGGMHDGFKMIDDDCEYVCQWDNDCAPISDNFLKEIVEIMDNNPKIGMLMLKRTGVKNNIKLKNHSIKFKDYKIGDIEQATCCVIIRRSLLDKLNFWYTGEKIGWGFGISNLIKKNGYRICKIENILVNHIDGWAGSDPILQIKKFTKFYNSITNKASNYKNFRYTR